MLAQAIWIAAVALEALLVVRSFFRGLLRQYPYFYGYIGFVLVQDVLRMFVYRLHPTSYPQVYWSTQFLGVLFGCGVLWEVYRTALAPFPGVKRMARYILWLLVIVLLLKAVLNHGFWSSSRAILTTLDIERDLRLVQAIALTALISVFVFYGLPLGRNLRALVFGYGIFLATSVVNLAVRGQLGDRFQLAWQLLQPSLYLMVLLVWAFGMWCPSPKEPPRDAAKIAQDYERLARSTRTRLDELKSLINKGIRA